MQRRSHQSSTAGSSGAHNVIFKAAIRDHNENRGNFQKILLGIKSGSKNHILGVLAKDNYGKIRRLFGFQRAYGFQPSYAGQARLENN